jgi:hypothetical protein
MRQNRYYMNTTRVRIWTEVCAQFLCTDVTQVPCPLPRTLPQGAASAEQAYLGLCHESATTCAANSRCSSTRSILRHLMPPVRDLQCLRGRSRHQAGALHPSVYPLHLRVCRPDHRWATRLRTDSDNAKHTALPVCPHIGTNTLCLFSSAVYFTNEVSSSVPIIHIPHVRIQRQHISARCRVLRR